MVRNIQKFVYELACQIRDTKIHALVKLDTS